MATTKKKAKSKKQGADDTARKSTEIPLENIPDRAERRVYSDEFKTQVAERIIKGNEIPEQVGRELGIAPSVIGGWVKRIREGLPLTMPRGGNRVAGQSVKKKDGAPPEDISATLRATLDRATKARDERLEMAACIVEADANGERASADIAKRIRELKRSQT